MIKWKPNYEKRDFTEVAFRLRYQRVSRDVDAINKSEGMVCRSDMDIFWVDLIGQKFSEWKNPRVSNKIKLEKLSAAIAQIWGNNKFNAEKHWQKRKMLCESGHTLKFGRTKPYDICCHLHASHPYLTDWNKVVVRAAEVSGQFAAGEAEEQIQRRESAERREIERRKAEALDEQMALFQESAERVRN